MGLTVTFAELPITPIRTGGFAGDVHQIFALNAALQEMQAMMGILWTR
jgi:hypothetical protein